VVWFLSRTGWTISYAAACGAMLIRPLLSFASGEVTRRALAHGGSTGPAVPFGFGFGLLGGLTGILSLLAADRVIQSFATRLGGRPAYAAVTLPAGAPEPPATFAGPAPALSSPSHDGYELRLRRVQSAVADVTNSLTYCSFANLPNRVSEGLETLHALTRELDATIPPTMQAEGPQALLA
jgi:hypothetical protein